MSWLDAAPAIPPNWCWTTVGAVSDVALGKMLDAKQQTGLHPSRYLRNINIQWHRVDLGDLLVMDVPPHQLERYRVSAGDLLICEGGEPGRCAIAPAGAEGLAYQKALHRLRPCPGVDVRYLAYAFEFMTRAGYTADALTGSTIKHLPLEKVVALPIPLAPTETQARIADELDRRLSIYDAVLEGLRTLVGTVSVTPESRMGQLRKSVLAAAFAGRLLPEDQQREPATALLEQIAEHRRSALAGRTAPASRSRRAVTSASETA